MTEKLSRERRKDLIFKLVAWADFFKYECSHSEEVNWTEEDEQAYQQIKAILQEEREEKEPSKKFLEKQRKILKRKKLPIFDEKGKEFMSLDLVFLKDNQIDSFVKELIQDWEKERRK